MGYYTKEWNSGPVNWLLHVIAQDRKSTSKVIAYFRQVVKEGDLRIHPIVAGLVDGDMRGKMMQNVHAQKPTACFLHNLGIAWVAPTLHQTTRQICHPPPRAFVATAPGPTGHRGAASVEWVKPTSF